MIDITIDPIPHLDYGKCLFPYLHCHYQKVGGDALLSVGIAYPEAYTDEIVVYCLHGNENKS
jgi:hypothetical protein